MDAGANAAVLPALSVASLLGFGPMVAALPLNWCASGFCRSRVVHWRRWRWPPMCSPR
ncbi:hypothetical protein ACU4GD_06250 [Cupriavidus basilensis]